MRGHLSAAFVELREHTQIWITILTAHYQDGNAKRTGRHISQNKVQHPPEQTSLGDGRKSLELKCQPLVRCPKIHTYEVEGNIFPSSHFLKLRIM